MSNATPAAQGPDASALAAIDSYIDRHVDDLVDAVRAYVRHPSVSVGGGEGMAECAAHVAQRYRDFGCQEVEIVETETYPGVWAYYDAGAPVTILSYNMYDVRSVGDVAEWTRPPFEPELAPRGGVPAVLYGRGAAVPKGPDSAWLAGLTAIKEATGTLPVNIAFLAEGDEILGSISYAGLIERYRDRLASVDALIYLRATQEQSGLVPLRLGYKSFITFELKVSGRSWGRGPGDTYAHSALRVVLDSPALRLAQALTSLYTADGEVAVDGWDTLLAPAEVPEGDRDLIEALLEHFAGQPWDKVLPALSGVGAKAFAGDLKGPEILTRYIYGSALNVQGFEAGYTGPGTRTYTIPEAATSRLDARLNTTADPAEFVTLLREHLDVRGFGDVEISVLSAYPASRADYHSDLIQSFVGTVREFGGSVLTWPVQPYGGPWSLLTHTYGTPVVFATGIGHAGGVGLPDEYIVVDGGGKLNGLPEMAKFAARLVLDFARSTLTSRSAQE